MTSRRRLPRHILTISLMGMMLLPAGVGLAQEQRRTLFDMLFGNQRRQPESSIIQVRPRPERVRPQGVPRPSAPAPVRPPVTAPQPETVEKMDNARKILVVGDFGAMGVGQGLETAFQQDPSVLVVQKGSVASGLVRQDHYDWLSELPACSIRKSHKSSSSCWCQ